LKNKIFLLFFTMPPLLWLIALKGQPEGKHIAIWTASVLIAADSEEKAREYASNCSRNEGHEVWSDDKRSTAVVIGTGIESCAPGMIISEKFYNF
jgi:hypothetical protein